MFKEATKILNSAFHQSFTKRLSLYLHDCIREEVQSSTFRNLRQDKDNQWIFLCESFEDESVFKSYPKTTKFDGLRSDITSIMLQSEGNLQDKYLIYGFLFLEGKSNAIKKGGNEFLTPLLYMPIKLEREDKNIKCILLDENLSLNTGALTSLLNKNDDEDETEQILYGLLDVVPQLPLTKDSLEIFITTLKSILPDIKISSDILLENTENEIIKDITKNNDTVDETLKKMMVNTKGAIILTKRPNVTAGVLHELTKISEKPSGIFRETALGVINDEYEKINKLPSKKNEISEFFPITPLNLSDSQTNVLEQIDKNTLVSVFGPPGTGKSQTIVNLITHLVANNKTVLLASRMDKAVDVVCDRLNDFEAPFLTLRAGRTNYQKKLHIELTNLLNGKIDLDTDFDECLLVENIDMKNLLDKISNLEEKCEKILTLEKNWTKNLFEIEELKKITSDFKVLNNSYTLEKIEHIEKLLEDIEINENEENFINKVKNFFNYLNLKFILKIKNIDNQNIDIHSIKLEVNCLKLMKKLEKIENQIFKTGNIHSILNEIKILKKNKSQLAKNILKKQRRESLKELLRDEIKKNRIKIHAQSIIQRKKNSQARLLENEDFKPLLDAFPCWGVTTYAISQSIPLKPGLFDVVIIDEASQCDIASCFPLLFRAKKAVIVGDDKQLPHLSFLEKAKEQSYLAKYEIPDKYQLIWKFRTNSMFDLANYYSNSQVLLDEHFRSVPSIINFSNKMFYNDQIKVMKVENDETLALDLEIVENGKIEFGVTKNEIEIEALIKRLYQIIINDEKNEIPLTIGIISPFRAQVEALEKAVNFVLSPDLIKRHKIEIGTAHTFQGDEKDVILISWTYANNSYFQSLTFLQKPNLFNVAITRAKKQVISFISKDPKTLPKGLLKDYLENIIAHGEKKKLKQQFQNTDNIIDFKEYKNSFEKEIANKLRNEGYVVEPNFEIASLNCDLLVKNKENKTIVIEIDGFEDKIKEKIKNIKKQTLIERSGFKVVRVTYREWYYCEKAVLNRIYDSF